MPVQLRNAVARTEKIHETNHVQAIDTQRQSHPRDCRCAKVDSQHDAERSRRRVRGAASGTEAREEGSEVMNAFTFPTPATLAKVGSIVVHCREYFSTDGHEFDREALMALLIDPDVRMFIEAGQKLAMVPEPRTAKRAAKRGK
jgi:hypothetical protein